MKRKALTLTLISAFLFSAITGTMLVNLAEANFFGSLPTITIRKDGTVEPVTGYINQTGNTYTLTSNIYRKYAIVIQRSNIVLDGAGHIMDGSYAKGIPYLNNGLKLEGLTNVTVKNISVVGFATGITLSNCPACTVLKAVISDIYLSNSNFTIITECNIDGLSLGENNQVTKSNITNLALGSNNIVTENNITQLRVWRSAGNTVYNNNIYRPFYYNEFQDIIDFETLATLGKNHWEGNFWDDYSTKYPNASEIGGSGIGDTPYVIDANNTDNYPLMAPFIVPPPEPFITMPEEYINYTITTVNGSPWAKIDGTYPLHVLFWPEPLLLFYPTPPGTTNISVKMDETELSWNNFTEIYPEALHFTAIGNWPMINCTINPVPEYFTLKIHYEHPVMLINGNHTFLYDLNISPYLSEWSTKSTAYFTIRMETNCTSLHVNAIATDETLTPINYTTTTDGTAETVTFQIVSEYSKPLLGDILVTFTTANSPTAVEFSYLLIILPIAIIAALIARIAYKRKESKFKPTTRSNS